MAQVTGELARFLAEARWEDVPPAIRQEGKRAILNIAGCILAGRKEPEVERLRKTFPLDDALVDAAAATAHDYDDTHLRTVIHATPPVAGALFSLARKRKVSGPELLHAFLLGVETTCRMGNAVMPGHYERGWHITSTCGIFGVAAASAKILQLNEKQTLAALGIAATQAAGLVEVLGSMARILNAAFAARNGLGAALLAEQGFQGPERAARGVARIRQCVRRQQRPRCDNAGTGTALGAAERKLQALPLRCGAPRADRRLSRSKRKNQGS
jgi:2-methylcitrate dehydratase PrpD